MTADMLRALEELGHRVEIATVGKAPSLGMRLSTVRTGDRTVSEFGSVRGHFLPLNTWRWSRSFYKFLGQFDAVVAVCGSPYIAAPLVCGRVPVFIWSAVAMREDLKGRLESFGAIKRAVYRSSQSCIEREEQRAVCGSKHVWALSDATFNDLRLLSDGSSPQVSRLFPPIDTVLFSPPATVPADRLVLFTGRYEDRRKDVETLLQAFRQVLVRVPDACLRIIGPAAPGNHVERLAFELALGPRVEFLPPLPRATLVEHYRAASVFVIPSRQEGLCISGVEAMACGVPVVSTRCGGPESYVESGQNGFLVEVQDAFGMASQLTRILENPAFRDVLSKRARERATQLFCWSSFKETIQKQITRHLN